MAAGILIPAMPQIAANAGSGKHGSESSGFDEGATGLHPGGRPDRFRAVGGADANVTGVVTAVPDANGTPGSASTTR